MTQKLDTQQAKKAITALYKFNKNKAENDMLNDDEDNAVYVVIHTHKIMNKAQAKLKQIKLPVSPFSEDLEVCYFTKDDEKKVEVKAKNSPIKKRKLAASYNLFVADDRVAPLIPSLLGKAFRTKSRMPVTMKHNGSLKTNIQNVINSTTVKLNNGLKSRILIGNFAMSEKDVLKNYEAAMPEIIKITAHKLDQVEMFGIESENSPFLPIYTALPKAEINDDDKTTDAKKPTATSKKATVTKKKAPAVTEKKIAVPSAKKNESKKITKKVAATKNKK
ncbi:ribosomal protein L1-like protein [Parasitella parasitica]|nr:ribosomal protein L1-like protein [Parasitella parasitica]